MATDASFLEHCRDLFTDLGPIRTGRLFGGTSLYVDDAMFGTIFGNTLYMKASGVLIDAYTEAGAAPFVYDTKTGPRTIAGLMSLPESALDDPDEALDWARKSLSIAREVAATKSAKKRSNS